MTPLVETVFQLLVITHFCNIFQWYEDLHKIPHIKEWNQHQTPAFSQSVFVLHKLGCTQLKDYFEIILLEGLKELKSIRRMIFYSIIFCYRFAIVLLFWVLTFFFMQDWWDKPLGREKRHGTLSKNHVHKIGRTRGSFTAKRWSTTTHETSWLFD